MWQYWLLISSYHLYINFQIWVARLKTHGWTKHKNLSPRAYLAWWLKIIHVKIIFSTKKWNQFLSLPLDLLDNNLSMWEMAQQLLRSVATMAKCQLILEIHTYHSHPAPSMSCSVSLLFTIFYCSTCSWKSNFLFIRPKKEKLNFLLLAF